MPRPLDPTPAEPGLTEPTPADSPAEPTPADSPAEPSPAEPGGGGQESLSWAGRRRPVLAPTAQRLWRDAETLQLGSSAGAVVLCGLDPAARAVVDRLDGSLDSAGVLRYAALVGCPPDRARALLDLLDGAGLLLTEEPLPAKPPPTRRKSGPDDTAPPSPWATLSVAARDRLIPERLALDHLGDGTAVLDRRLAACVRVVGAGRVGAPLASLLAVSGVGAVDLVDGGLTSDVDLSPGGLTDADVGTRRDVAAARRASASAGEADGAEQPLDHAGQPLRPFVPRAAAALRARPDLVVLAPISPAHLRADLSAVPPGVAHLLVEVRETVGVVGPCVVPGITACLRCLDLARTDRDPAWPQLSLQLDEARPTPCDGLLATAVATQAALQTLSFLDATPHGSPAGRLPATACGTLELGRNDWRWRRRSWPVHPDCRCTTRAA